MRVLVLNSGSSSVKYLLAEVEGGGAGEPDVRPVLRGRIERIGVPGGVAADHRTAIAEVLRRVVTPGEAPVAAVGHRVVHGGERFSAPALVEGAVWEAIAAADDLSPLHNAPCLAGMRAAEALLPGVPMVAVFDTAFHAGLPEAARTYALPRALAERHRIRRYGFHGTSYRYVLGRYARLAGLPVAEATVVAFHLGNGCSATAILRGRSVETSMGASPLEGLVMGTRSGDLDPAIVGLLARKEGFQAERSVHLLNRESGLLGLAGRSDVRDLLAREAQDGAARLALAVFCHRARKYLGAYLAVLGGAQAVLFTGGIGENAAPIRERICAGMGWCGIALDPAHNRAVAGEEACVSPPGTPVPVYVIPTDEERQIALETAGVLAPRAAPG
ncbi:MAG: acetate/propionate family kinase [Candidatus Lambdaproteobacteria bacterium]|nr:acetate/propionate family kinase [Candidatus Lambdaproteobacteria bacterium]